MNRIQPNLWFDSEAEEAANFYKSVFRNARIGRISRYGKAGFEIHGQPEGKVMTVDFEIEGLLFTGLNAGPVFKFNPSISFMVLCDTAAEVDELWARLSVGGTALMEVGAYPFSERYGWLQDRFGVSWQLILLPGHPLNAKVVPMLMFTRKADAEAAIISYVSIFRNAAVGPIRRTAEGTVEHANFTLEGQEFTAFDSVGPHNFAFNEAVSFLVRCETQEEIDYYWESLTKGGDPKAQQCGWLKDRFGVSWQVSPTILEEMLQDPDQKKVERVTNAFLKMKKLDIPKLKQAFEG
jgi:predicted 3-demethylubiquinone-9 3-methyltransferase (glyoxalase superfamily)